MTVSGLTVFKVNISEDMVTSMEELVKDRPDVPESIQRIIQDKSASLDDIKHIQTYFKEGLMVHELLGASEIVLPEPIVEPRNPELEARVQRLRRMVEQQKYDQMTKNVRAKGRDPDDSVGAQLHFMNKQLVAVAQFVVSVGSGFAFGFYGIELIVGELDFGFKLLLGVICALVIALAEIYFLAKIIAELDLEGIVKTEEESTPKHTPKHRRSFDVNSPDDTGQNKPFTEKLHQD